MGSASVILLEDVFLAKTKVRMGGYRDEIN
jgi:hypothetical protein